MEEMAIKVPWDGWTSIGKLGTGGFGTVYKIVRNANSPREEFCAMKVITIPNSQDEIDVLGYEPEMIRTKVKEKYNQVLKEYQIMKKMQGHSNIVNCLDIYEEELSDRIGWRVYIRMEYLTPLQQYLKNHNLPVKDVIRLGIDICRALVLCESKEIVHRDIKPENIMYSTDIDVFKLGDFGIARTMGHLTTGTMIGTPNYEAPEVYNSEKYDNRVDIYSLGLVLYWLLNRRRLPFWPNDRPPSGLEMEEAIRRRNVKGEPLPTPATGSRQLKAVVMKACSYDKNDRYLSAEDMLEDLERIKVRTGQSKPKQEAMDQCGNNQCDKTDDGNAGISERRAVDEYSGKPNGLLEKTEELARFETKGNKWGVSKPIVQFLTDNRKHNSEEVDKTVGAATYNDKLEDSLSEDEGPVRGTTEEQSKKEKKLSGRCPIGRLLLLEIVFMIIYYGAVNSWNAEFSLSALVNYYTSSFDIIELIFYYSGPLIMLLFWYIWYIGVAIGYFLTVVNCFFIVFTFIVAILFKIDNSVIQGIGVLIAIFISGYVSVMVLYKYLFYEYYKWWKEEGKP